MRALAVLLLLAVLLAGCSYLDMGVSSNRSEWGRSYLLADKSPERLRAERAARVLAVAAAQPPLEAEAYLIGPDDILEVSVYALEKPDETAILSRTVGQDGRIALPWVGGVSVAGLPAAGAVERIEAAYADRYLKDPQVAVTVTERLSKQVVVTGAVKTPGVFPLTENRTTVIQAISMAGGLTKEAGDNVLLMRAGGKGELVSIDVTGLMDEGDTRLNLQVGEGDIVSVPPRVDDLVYILGYVRRPGAHKLQRNTRLDALQAVAMSGGLSATGRAERSWLIRETAGGQETIPVNLKDVARSKLPALYLQKGDVLVVGTTFWGRVSEFFAPKMGASVSASASVAP